MPTLYMLIGVPGAGKSFWLSQQNFDMDRTALIGTDHYIETWAELQGKTYSEMFPALIKNAEQAMNNDLREALATEQDIVWDQTNTSVKVRRQKLAKIPSHYRKVAVFFRTPAKEELDRRLASRQGKTIPPHVVQSMASNLEPPTQAEGFDEVVTVS